MPTTKDHMPMTKNKIFAKQYQKRTNMTSIGIGCEFKEIFKNSGFMGYIQWLLLHNLS